MYDAYHEIHNLSRLDDTEVINSHIVGPICESGTLPRNPIAPPLECKCACAACVRRVFLPLSQPLCRYMSLDLCSLMHDFGLGPSSLRIWLTLNQRGLQQ